MAGYTIWDFLRDYPNEEACLDWARRRRWPRGIRCETCRRVTKHHRVRSRRSYSCDRCGNHVHPTAGTLLHRSHAPLRAWFFTVLLVATTRRDIRPSPVARLTGVNPKTASDMLDTIQHAFYGARRLSVDSVRFKELLARLVETRPEPAPPPERRKPTIEREPGQRAGGRGGRRSCSNTAGGPGGPTPQMDG